jgi:hypothetical protein
VAGHGRLRAAQLLGIDQVPTIRLETLSEDQIRAYVLADNKLAENAGWDESILAIELQHVITVDSGFGGHCDWLRSPEIDFILKQAEAKPDADDAFEVPPGPSVACRVIWGFLVNIGFFAATPSMSSPTSASWRAVRLTQSS